MTRSFPRARWAALASLLVVAFLSGGWLLRPRPSAGGGVYERARLFESVVGAIHRHYIDSLGEGDLYQQAADALVGTLHDPYAELLVKDSYREYQRQMAGTEIDLERGPSESGWEGGAGGSVIAPGDEVLSIDGENTSGWPAERLDEVLRRGSSPMVTVVMRPRGASQPVVRRFTRTEIHVPAASRGVLLADKVGYIVLRRMSQGASDELRAAVDTLVAQGMTSLVLDLRSNPGGLIREGIAVAGLFLEPGDTVATSVGRSSARAKTYLAEVPGGWGNLRLAVLVNRGTASSAELIAGALQDHDRAVIVGTPTYGKGVLQTTYPIGEDVALKLTTARWYTPSGRTVQRPRADSAGGPGNRTPATRPQVFFSRRGRVVPDASGILPDLLVRAMRRSEGSDTLLRRKARSDRQLQAAMQVIRGSPTQDDALTAAMRAQLSGRVR